MSTIKISDLNEQLHTTVEDAANVKGGNKAKPSSKQVYLEYKLEDVLISSY